MKTKWIISPYHTTHTLLSNLKKTISTPHFQSHLHYHSPPLRSPWPPSPSTSSCAPPPLAPPRLPRPPPRRAAASTALAATAALSARRPAAPPPAMAAEAAAVPPPPPGPGTVPRWGTRSYVRERFFEPGLTAEEAAARIRQTAEGMRTLRPMLETMSWKYVLFYVRLKSKYLDLDLTTAMFSVPEARRADYVRVANELVDNMTEVSLVYYTFPNEIKLT